MNENRRCLLEICAATKVYVAPVESDSPRRGMQTNGRWQDDLGTHWCNKPLARILPGIETPGERNLSLTLEIALRVVSMALCDLGERPYSATYETVLRWGS